MSKHLRKRFLCLLLAAVMVLGLLPAVSVSASGLRWELTGPAPVPDRSDRLVTDSTTGEQTHKSTDTVRVSILLEETPTLRAGYSTTGLSLNPQAAAHDLSLQKQQRGMAQRISAQALGGRGLDVVWNLTTICNIISANVPYGSLEAIRNVRGVRDVVLEQQYTVDTLQPQTAISPSMTGVSRLWQSGMTGAGARIAIIDTGTDTDHQSFDTEAYLYALEENANALGMGYTEYVDSLELLDAGEIAAVLAHLNAYERIGADAEDFYINEKLPFGANYVDYNLTVDHDHDFQGSHGSHVAGIAAANRYIPKNGGYVDALSAVRMTGTAPDAQIITLKVFGNGQGPYDSDYFAAIEDAIWLGCDSVNLSLGSGNPGVSHDPLFADILDFMATTDTVVVMSAGNSGTWAANSANGRLYADDVSFHTSGTPGTYTNSLSVASVENDGLMGPYLDVAGRTVVYTEGQGLRNNAMTILDTSFDRTGTDYDYIFIDGPGRTEDYAGMDLHGKVVFCARGEISFGEKAANAVNLGAAAVVVCNNDSGVLYMDLSGYRSGAPCVSIQQKDAQAIRATSVQQTTADGLRYCTGTLRVVRENGVSILNSEYYTMSSFSSWGVPGSLEMKPEITAPGGSIWSVNGVDTSGTAYELMSGTSMAAPHVTGMAALVAEYIRQNGLDTKTGLSLRHLTQSLLMSTAVPLREEAADGAYYSILTQGAGLARVDLAVSAESYLLVDGMPDGKVKVELGEDPSREGIYDFSFTIHNLTDGEMVYSLRADLFTQGLVSAIDGTTYLDTSTRSLPVQASFFSGGESLESTGSDFAWDLNGDGVTGTADADHLLEYLLGNTDTLCADGDLSGDGAITSYDAHLLLSRLTGDYQALVPAKGSTKIDVRLELTQEGKALLDEEYPTGAYVEGYVFAEPVTDDEGKVGVTHSIPLLGYYGSWTEPGMYDVGGYVEHLSGSETRLPYLHQVNGFESNFVSIRYGGRDEYLFGGNPYTQEAEYLPQRNAFNNRSGWTLQSLRYTLIRNASAATLLLENADTGEVYERRELGKLEGAYYHVNAQSWQNVQQRVNLGLDLSGFAEGTRLQLRLVAAPELYGSTESVDWDALGEGASLTTSFTIDNTAPVIRDMALAEGRFLHVTARDNQYIAAVALLDSTGAAITTCAANQTEQGKEITVEMDLQNVYGDQFQLAVYDYAGNSVACAVTLELESQRPYFTAIDCSSETGVYTGLLEDGSTTTLTAATNRAVAQAAEYAEGAVFEISRDGQLYAAYDRDLYSFTCLGRLDPEDQWQVVTFCDMAYNRQDGKLYVLFYSRSNNMAVPYLATIDPYTGTMNVQGSMPIDANTLTIDGSGIFYSTIYGQAQLYRYDSNVVQSRKVTLIGYLNGHRTTDLSSLAWDHNTDSLYWAYNNNSAHALLKLDPETGSAQLLHQYSFYFGGLYIAYPADEKVFAPTDAVASVTMPETAQSLVGHSLQLSARVLPWNIRDDSLDWSSSDSSVATVDDTGLVRCLSAGTAVITAASQLNNSVRASCTVTVSTLDSSLKALVWDENGQVWWSRFRTDALPHYEQLAAVPENQSLSTTMVADGALYAATLDLSDGFSTLYRVDPQSYEMSLVGPSSIAYMDMAYAPSLGYGLAVYFNYVAVVDLETGEYIGSWNWSEMTAGNLVGITYYGTEYHDSYGTNMDYFLLLDEFGNVYLDAWISIGGSIGYFNGPREGYVATIGSPVEPSYFQDLYYDGSYVYWTRFNEPDNVVELIAWDCDGSAEVYSLGYFAEGIWPVGGMYTDAQLQGSALAMDGLSTKPIRAVADTTAIPPVSMTQPGGSLQAGENSGQDEAVRLTLTVPTGAQAPTNGTLTLSYDTEAMELMTVTGATEAFAWRQTEAGTVTVAFADRNALSVSDAMAQLIFRPLDTGSTTVTVRYGQWNQWSLAAAEEIEVELPKPYMPFTDVPDGSFYYDPVLWAIGNGITNGATETTFDPNGDCLRAAVVTFLWRASGSPEPSSSHNPFTDVKEKDFFYKAVLWAVEMGITNGTSATTFSPYAKCNRAQVVTFLWRAMGQPVPSSQSNPFTDVTISQFYGQAVLWAVEMGITNGMGDGTFGVGSTCNRAQVVTFLYRTLAK